MNTRVWTWIVAVGIAGEKGGVRGVDGSVVIAAEEERPRRA
jgi:hypothetical protein